MNVGIFKNIHIVLLVSHNIVIDLNNVINEREEERERDVGESGGRREKETNKLKN